jgi:hypothetical protein
MSGFNYINESALRRIVREMLQEGSVVDIQPDAFPGWKAYLAVDRDKKIGVWDAWRQRQFAIGMTNPRDISFKSYQMWLDDMKRRGKIKGPETGEAHYKAVIDALSSETKPTLDYIDSLSNITASFDARGMKIGGF